MKYPDDLVLKLDSFGFGKWYTPSQQEQEQKDRASSGTRTGMTAHRCDRAQV